MGGYSVAGQTFAVCDTLSSGLIADSLSGIMGLSWQALAYSKGTSIVPLYSDACATYTDWTAIPWWLNLVNSGSWSQPLFGFYLARYRDVVGASRLETDGGKATFGYLDSSLYTGDVTYVSVPDNSQYWRIPMDSVTMQGTSISLDAGNSVAVDTGTTLIGGPSDTVRVIYEAIDGARQMTGNYRNYYEYPCTTNIDFVLTFGGYSIHITDKDFNLGRYGSDPAYCTGAVFVQALPSGSPIQWIVGDTALKNTYTVFRASPPAVGFAALPGDAGQSGQTTQIPSAAPLETGDPLESGSASPTGSSNSTRSATSTGSGSATGSGSRSGSASSTGSAGASQTSSPSVDPNQQADATVTAVITAGDVNGAAASQPSDNSVQSSAAAFRRADAGLAGSGLGRGVAVVFVALLSLGMGGAMVL